MLNNNDIKQLTEFRKLLHSRPELSGEEKETAKKIVDFLKDCKPSEIITSVGGHGVVAVFDSKKEGLNVLFRADMDALPIAETNDFEYRSKTEGASHKCGHDGHTSILLGLAKYLSKSPPKKGKALLLFQPAEETGEGATKVLQDEKFTNLKPDWVFGLHNLPGFPLHDIIIKKGSFTAAVTSIVIDLQGKTAHAAEPEHGINPALAISELFLQASIWSNNCAEREDFAVVTPVHVELGSIAYGTAAGKATLGLTLRTWTEKEMNKLQEKIELFLIALAKKHQLKLNYYYTQEFKANENNTEAVKSIKSAVEKLQLSITEKEMPFKWGEDFGLFTQEYKGAFFGIGAGENSSALHNPDYDFPDTLLPTGVSVFGQLCKTYLACK